MKSKSAASTATPAINPVEFVALGSELEVAAAALAALVSLPPKDGLRAVGVVDAPGEPSWLALLVD